MAIERRYILLSCVVASQLSHVIVKYRLLNPVNWASSNLDANKLGMALLANQAVIPGIKVEKVGKNKTRLTPMYGSISRYAHVVENPDKVVSTNRPVIIVRLRKGIGCLYTDPLGKTKNYCRYNRLIRRILFTTVSNGRFIEGANGEMDLVPLDETDSFSDLTAEDLKEINSLGPDSAEVPVDDIVNYMAVVEGEKDWRVNKEETDLSVSVDVVKVEDNTNREENGIHANTVYHYNGKEFTITDENGRERTVVVYFDNVPQKISCRTALGSLETDSEMCKPELLFINEELGEYQLKVSEKFERANKFLYDTRPFYHGVFRNLERRVSDDLDTMGVTLNTLCYNLDFVKGLTVPEMNFVSLHEISHLIFKHILREKGRKHELWNVVCDFYINKLIWDEFGFAYAILVNLPLSREIRNNPRLLSMPQLSGGIEYSMLPNQFLLDINGKKIPTQSGDFLKAQNNSAITYIDQFGVLHPGKDFCQVRTKKAWAGSYGVNTIIDAGVRADTTTIGIKLPDGLLFNEKVDVNTDTPEAMYAEFMRDRKQWKFYLTGMNGKPFIIPDNNGRLTPSGLPQGWENMPDVAGIVTIVESLVQLGLNSNAIAALLAESYVQEYESNGVNLDFGDVYINPIFKRFKQKRKVSEQDKSGLTDKGGVSLSRIKESKIFDHLNDFDGEDALGRKPKGVTSPILSKNISEDSDTNVRKERDRNFSKLAKQIMAYLKKQYPDGIKEDMKPIINQIGDGSNQILMEYVEYYCKGELFYHEYIFHITSGSGGGNGKPLDKGRTLQSGNGGDGDIGDYEPDEDTVEDEQSSSLSDESRDYAHENILRKAKAYEQQTVRSKSYGGSVRETIVAGFVNKLLVPRLDWRTYLKNRLQLVASEETSYSKPNKRLLASTGLYFAGPIKSESLASGLKLCVDTSGSMSDKDIAYAFEQMVDLFNSDYQIGAEIIFWDDKVQGVLPFTNLMDLLEARHKVVGRGGTDPNCIFNYFKNSRDYVFGVKEKPVLIVIFTDGEIIPVQENEYWEYSKDTLWVINRNSPKSFQTDFGVVAELYSIE